MSFGRQIADSLIENEDGSLTGSFDARPVYEPGPAQLPPVSALRVIECVKEFTFERGLPDDYAVEYDVQPMHERGGARVTVRITRDNVIEATVNFVFKPGQLTAN